jgi:hypothetical protein
VFDFRPFRFHDLRHLHAIEWLRSGRSILELQHRLGHASIKTIEEYLKAGYLTYDRQEACKAALPGRHGLIEGDRMIGGQRGHKSGHMTPLRPHADPIESTDFIVVSETPSNCRLRFSKPPPSATRPRLRTQNWLKINALYVKNREHR